MTNDFLPVRIHMSMQFLRKMCLPLYINTEVTSFDNLLYRKIIGEYGYGSEVGQMIMAKHNPLKKERFTKWVK